MSKGKEKKCWNSSRIGTQYPDCQYPDSGFLGTEYWQLGTDFMKRVVHAACPHDCPDACGVLITIEDGRATRIQGDPDHPVTADSSAPKSPSISTACTPQIACSIPCGG